MTTILSTTFSWNRETKTFKVNGNDVPFDTSYKLKNTITNKVMVFEFSHSTGSEWDSATKWIYKNGDYILEVGNEDVTPAHAEAYLQAKLRNM